VATFGLVHGAWHGAWCWERLTPELEQRGHRVIAMDLPIDDSAASFDDYADTVCASLADVSGDQLVLVGHSLGGVIIPLVAARRPVRHLVYLCGVVPIPGRPLIQQIIDDSDMMNPDHTQGLSGKDAERRRSWIDKRLAHFHMYGDCDDDTVSAAFTRLRPQSLVPYKIPCSLGAYPVVDTTYVVCEEDRMVNPDWSRRIAHEWLRADLIEMPGSHSPFLSRPGHLANLLDRLG